MHDNNCVDNFDRIDNDNVRMHFFVRIQQRKHLKTGKYLEVHAQITNNKKKWCHSKIFRLYLV